MCRAVRAQLKWFARARFSDYLVAAGDVPSALPLVGRHLDPLGGLTAMGLWGPRYLADFLRLTPLPMTAGHAAARRGRDEVNSLMLAGLADVVPPEALTEPWPPGEPGAPWRNAGRHRRLVHRDSVAYGDEPGQVLDVWRRADVEGPAPVLVFVPGGAWVVGSRLVQGHALMAHLAEMGWLCLSVEYRTSPRHRWPRQITDVTAAIDWARANVQSFGGDPSFVAVAGCSAGGHIASLTGLTPDRGAVDAVVSIYGRYDWEDRSTAERARFMDFLERVVVKRRQARYPEVFRAASPLAHVGPDAPPFLVLHGENDALIPIAEARRFVAALRSVSRNPVGFVELPGAGHGFDLIDAARTAATVRAIGLFLNHAYREHIAARDMVAVPS